MPDDVLIDTGTITVEEGENVFIKLCDFFAAQGCEEFAVEDGILYLRWPDGTEQKVKIDEGVTVQ